jgi:serine/threonine-protein kinase HipA
MIQLVNDGSALGGARPKFSVEIEGRLWIAKLPRKSDIYSVAHAERLAMLLAEKIETINPAQSRLFEADNKQMIYETARFDRLADEDNLQAIRIPFISALTLLGEHESAGHHRSYGDIADAIRRYGSKPKDDLKQLFARMVFNVLCSNTDDHLRNHGFLYDLERGGWKLSPAYDIVPTPRSSHTAHLTLRIGDHNKEATLANCWSARHKFGLTDDQAMTMIEDIRQTVAGSWSQIAAEIGMSAEDKLKMAGCFARAMESDWKATPQPTMRG